MSHCIICGCTGTSACQDRKLGPCGWKSYDPPICTHCHPEVFARIERPTANLKRVKVLSAIEIQEALNAVYFKVKVKEISDGAVAVQLHRSVSDERIFDLLLKTLKAWYPNTKQVLRRVFEFKPDEQAFLLYKKKQKEAAEV